LEALHQACVAHALRRGHNLETTLSGRARAFPRQVIDLMQEALKLRDAFRDGQVASADLPMKYQEYGDRLCHLTENPRANEANETFAKHLYRYTANWFLFVLDPELPATNHRAEQALRTPIVKRKVFGGNRSDAGCTAQVITGSTIQTCKQQKRSAMAFLRATVCGLAQTIFTAATGASASAPGLPRLTHLG
jgi:transposase